MKLKGAEILIECLVEQNVDTVFGYPGASVLSVYDAMDGSSVRHILTAHEQGACFAAEGYARAGRKAGVVLTTSGPGATNLVTGIADAYMDSVPLVAITGNVSLSLLGHDSFQEVDIFGMTLPVTKYAIIVKSAAEIAPAVRKAFKVANEGRKGPVLVDIPSNVFDEYADYEKSLPQKRKSLAVSQEEIERAAEIINRSTKPVLYIGGGVRASDCEKEVALLASKLNAAVMVSYMGIGCFDPDEPCYLGVLSNDNTATTAALKDCDLLITLGARFNSRYSAFDIIKKRKIPLVQVDIDKAEIDKNVLTTASVTGDIAAALCALNPLIKDNLNNNWTFSDFIRPKEIHRGAEIIRYLSDKLGDSVIVSTDVGLHQEWTAHNYKFKSPKAFLTSGGLGAMGFGMGASIGAHLATNKPVLLITGDGSFNMNCTELGTAVKHHVPLIVVVLNNKSLGMIRKLQLARGKRTPASSLYVDVDYAALARSFGARAVTITETEDVKIATDAALRGTLPLVINCKLGINEGIQ